MPWGVQFIIDLEVLQELENAKVNPLFEALIPQWRTHKLTICLEVSDVQR